MKKEFVRTATEEQLAEIISIKHADIKKLLRRQEHQELQQDKSARYAGAQLFNAARQASHTATVAAAQTGAFAATLNTAPIDFTAEDRLRTEGTQYDNNLILRANDGTEIELIDVKIDVTQNNKISETQLINRAGKVKEFVQKDDYTIKVSGNLIGEKDKFPHEALKTLLHIFSGETLEVASVYFDTFGIHKVALKDAKFDQNSMKFFNIMPFTFTFVNDEEYNFLVEE